MKTKHKNNKKKEVDVKNTFEYLLSICFFIPTVKSVIKLSEILIIQQKSEIVEDIEEDHSEVQITKELRRYFERSAKDLRGMKIDVEELQRNVSEGLYGRLAAMGTKTYDSSEKIFEVRKEIPLKLSEFLGLHKSEIVLKEISEEFLLWLKDAGELITDWGKLSYIEPNKIYVEVCGSVENSSPTRRVIKKKQVKNIE